MFPENKFAIMLATIATVFVISLVGIFSTFMLIKSDSNYGGDFNIFKASGTGSQFKGLNKAVVR